jgi:hypothetical protein
MRQTLLPPEGAVDQSGGCTTHAMRSHNKKLRYVTLHRRQDFKVEGADNKL